MSIAASGSRAAAENVVIRAGGCTVSLFPEFGGKIGSIVVDGHELLQQPLAPIAARTKFMAFDAGDASGWDECLPSVAACTVETSAGAAEIPDHGDLWQVEWTRHPASMSAAQRVTLTGKCFSLPLSLRRALTLSEISNGYRLDLEYTLSNTGNVTAPWSWAAHPLFSTAAGDRIVLPESIRSLRLEGSGGNRLGRRGDTVSWPVARLSSGESADLSVAQSPDAEIGDKLFAGPLSEADNWCALERPSVGLRLRVGFDPAATPYLGLWICYGGWPERPGPKQVCVALEPATAPVDSLAEQGEWSRELAPHASVSWAMSLQIERI